MLPIDYPSPITDWCHQSTTTRLWPITHHPPCTRWSPITHHPPCRRSSPITRHSQAHQQPQISRQAPSHHESQINRHTHHLSSTTHITRHPSHYPPLLSPTTYHPYHPPPVTHITRTQWLVSNMCVIYHLHVISKTSDSCDSTDTAF